MKRFFSIVLTLALALSLAACGSAPASSSEPVSVSSAPQSEPASSGSKVDVPEGESTAPEGESTAPESESAVSESETAPESEADIPQGEPEEIDLDEMAALYTQTPVEDRLSGRAVQVTGYLLTDRDRNELYLRGISYENGGAHLHLVLELTGEEKELLSGEEFAYARVTLTGRIEEGMEEVRSETSGSLTYRYTMSDVAYVTNIVEVTGVLEQSDGIYFIQGVGDIYFLDGEEIPPVGSEVTLAGKTFYGGDFKEAIIVE